MTTKFTLENPISFEFVWLMCIAVLYCNFMSGVGRLGKGVDIAKKKMRMTQYMIFLCIGLSTDTS